VRGLTTAASIWITAAIGILAGAGFYFPVLLATLLTLGTLSVFRYIEGRMPSLFYVHYAVRFAQNQRLPEDEFRNLIVAHGFSMTELGYHMSAGGRYFEYRGVIRTLDKSNLRQLSDALRGNAAVIEFRMAPTGD
jgi:putative Mg2+ transporter-C (MgtC) family protein